MYNLYNYNKPDFKYSILWPYQASKNQVPNTIYDYNQIYMF